MDHMEGEINNFIMVWTIAASTMCYCHTIGKFIPQVSGLMHELVFYYVKREKRTFETWEPSWDSICFFLLHGVCLAIEVAVKKVFKGKWKLPRLLSWLLTVVFVIYTALWLFVPALVRCHVFEKEIKELNAIVEFGKDLYGSYF
ncbi:unnamed protein product [Lupinus luteus]|uniref:Uncharacterized protein n=1 Tax=Lupinus luteus TaxID=3873 RepID=A0AAV1WJ95_LUPLU